MMRRKNLERAVVLGLLLSTSVYGSAWAEDYEDGINVSGTYGNFTEDTTIGSNDNGWSINAFNEDITINGNTIKIDAVQLANITSGEARGIFVNGGSVVDVNANSDVNINVSGDQAYGIYAYEGKVDEVTIDAGNDINIETGIFGANMEVSLINDGPVSIIIEREPKSQWSLGVLLFDKIRSRAYHKFG